MIDGLRMASKCMEGGAESKTEKSSREKDSKGENILLVRSRISFQEFIEGLNCPSKEQRHFQLNASKCYQSNCAGSLS